VKPFKLYSADVVQIEELLKICVENYNQEVIYRFNQLKKKNPAEQLDSNRYLLDIKQYKVQLIGAMSANGEKEVYVNCFHKSLFREFSWKTQRVSVDDGGNYFFELIINLKTRSCSRLNVHGSA
jgi:hypothetical protein